MKECFNAASTNVATTVVKTLVQIEGARHFLSRALLLHKEASIYSPRSLFLVCFFYSPFLVSGF
jgi:hypothetical protein